MKKKTKIIIVVILVMAAIGGIMELLGITPDETETTTPTATVEAPANDSTTDKTPAADDAETSDSSDDAEGSDALDVQINFVGDVNNDVTGKWRYATTSENIDMLDYALPYYKAYFKSDDEIHGVVNFTRKVTTAIQRQDGNLIVTEHDYVDGEEHDAKLMFSGTLLGEWNIDIDSGEIEQIR